MEAKRDTKSVNGPAEEYRAPELIVHGNVAKITAGSTFGTVDPGGQTGSSFPDDGVQGD
jgi:hypothetical protein